MSYLAGLLQAALAMLLAAMGPNVPDTTKIQAIQSAQQTVTFVSSELSSGRYYNQYSNYNPYYYNYADTSYYPYNSYYNSYSNYNQAYNYNQSYNYNPYYYTGQVAGAYTTNAPELSYIPDQNYRSVTISWNYQSAQYVYVERATSFYGPWTRLNSGYYSGSQSFTDMNLPYGANILYYRIVPGDQYGGTYSPSGVASVDVSQYYFQY